MVEPGPDPSKVKLSLFIQVSGMRALKHRSKWGAPVLGVSMAKSVDLKEVWEPGGTGHRAWEDREEEDPQTGRAGWLVTSLILVTLP